MIDLKSIPKDKGTRIIDQYVLRIGDYEAVKQRWTWEGVLADSLIFVNDDVKALSDDELVTYINTHWDDEIIGSVTIKRSPQGFCFVNFNFVTF